MSGSRRRHTLRLELGVFREHVHREGMVPAPKDQHQTRHLVQEAHPPAVYCLNGIVNAVYGHHRQDRPEDLPATRQSLNSGTAEPEVNTAGGDALGHQGIISLHISDDGWDNEFALSVDLATEDDSAAGLVEEPLQALDMCIRDDACHGSFRRLQRIDWEEFIESKDHNVRYRVLRALRTNRRTRVGALRRRCPGSRAGPVCSPERDISGRDGLQRCP